MKPDLATLQRFIDMRDLALYAPLLTDDDRKACKQRIAEQAARDDAKRAAEPSA
jgi:hypothetical protein